MVTPADLAKFNNGVQRARDAYDGDNHCIHCHAPIAFSINRVPKRCADCRKENP